MKQFIRGMALSGIASISAANPHAVGTLPGKFSVANNGAANYHVPIEVPPGVNGLQPNLSLVYNSQKGNGLLGVGWSIDGLDTISRCQTNKAKDGFIDAVDFDDNDKFCLNGERLVAINGNYGVDGTEYRTENDSYAKIISYSRQGNGPAYFKVWFKNGHIAEFGVSDDSRIEANQQEHVAEWLINKSEDRFGNAITYQYNENRDTGEYYASSIQYANITLNFEYEARDDVLMNFKGGAKFCLEKRLKNILINGSNTTKTIKIAYKQAIFSKHSMINSVQMCTEKCLPATTFTYQENGNAPYFSAPEKVSSAFIHDNHWNSKHNYMPAEIADMNGDGLNDIIRFDSASRVSLNNGNGFSEPQTFHTSFGSGWSQKHRRELHDVNGDGLPDVIALAYESLEVGINNGNGFDKRWWTNKPRGLNSVGRNFLAFPDINGDGRSDILYTYYHAHSISLNNGNGTDIKYRKKLSYKDGWRNFHQRQVADVNGDRLPDFVGFKYKGAYIALNKGESFKDASVWLDDFSANQDWLNEKYIRQLVDVNNDGLSDIVGFNNEGVKVALSTGTSFTPAKYWSKSFGTNNSEWSHGGNTRTVRDVNGDGFPDVVGFGASGVYIAFNLGNRFAEPVKWIESFGYNHGWKKKHQVRYVRDMNGDGMPDIIGFKADGTYVSYSNLKKPLLVSIRNGFGKETKINYGYLSDKNLFTKSTGSQYPVQDLTPAFEVVSSYEMDNGVDGFNKTNYHYAGFKNHVTGLGSLGFSTITHTQMDTGIKVINHYAQDVNNHKIGLLTHSQTVSKDGVILKDQQQTWQVAKLEGGDIDRYQTLLASNITVQKSLQDEVLSTVTQQLTHDDFGNVTNSLTTNTDQYGSYTQTVNTDYNNDESTWLLGLATQTEDTRSHLATGSITRTKAFTYDDTTGKVLTQTIEPNQQALSVTSTFEYDAFGNQVKISKSGHQVPTVVDTFVYDDTGRFPVESTNALGHKISQTNHPFWGVMLTSTDANGLTTTNQYNSLGQLTQVNPPTGAVTTTTRGWCDDNCPGDQARYWVQVNTTGESPKRIYFDKLAREIRTETAGLDGTKIYVDTEYTALGKVKRKSVPYYASETSFYWNQYEYDELLRATKKIAPNGNVTTIAYNGLTQVYTNAKDQTKTVNKNALGQLVSVTDTNGQLLSYQYDSFGNLLETRDPLGNATQITYDLLGRKIAMNDPDKGEWQYAYDAFGRLIRQQDAKGQVTTIQYDVLGRMTQRVDHAQKEKKHWEISTWQYDQQKKGLLDSLTGPNFSRQLTYDNLSRVKSTTQASFSESFTLQQTYDNLGRPEKTIYPTGLISQKVYNDQGFLSQITDGKTSSPKVYWQATSADPYGNVTTALLGNGYENIRYVNQLTGRVDSVLAHLSSVSVATDYKYTYDKLGNLIQREDKDFNQGQGIVETFTFDELNRLTSATVTIGDEAPVTQQVEYDALGNITRKSDVGNYTYGGSCNGITAGPHAVTQTQGTQNATYCYDKNGNMTGGNGRSIAYTSFDKPNYITKGSASTAIDYGADRKRIRRIDTTSRGITTTYYMGGIYEKVEANGQVKHKHYIADVAIVTQTEGGDTKTNYLHRDHLNSVVSITNESGQVVERNSFDAWGKKRQENWKPARDYTTLVSRITTRGFTNHEHLDAVGLIHMNGRVYDPNLGRFLSADPFIQAPTILQSFNRYTYGFNNPLSMTDPTGFISRRNYGYVDRLYDSAINRVRNYNRPTPLRASIRYSHRAFRYRNRPANRASWRSPLNNRFRPLKPAHFPQHSEYKTIPGQYWPNMRPYGETQIHTGTLDEQEWLGFVPGVNVAYDYAVAMHDLSTAEKVTVGTVTAAAMGVVTKKIMVLKKLPFGTAGSGAGSKSGQLTANACGMACGQRLLAEQGIKVFQSNLMKGFYRGLTPEKLAANMNRHQSGWQGFMADLTQRDIAGLYETRGKYIARIGGNPGHFVSVESVSSGVVKYWDPSGGVIKSQPINKFTNMATGVVFR